MDSLPTPAKTGGFKKLLDKIPFFSGLSFSTQLSFLVIILVFLSIPLTVFSVKTIRDLRSRASVNCSVIASWPPNQNRPTDCTKNLTINWSSPGFTVGLGLNGAWVATSPQISETYHTFSGLSSNTTYTYVVCSPNCGSGKQIKTGSAPSNSSGSLTVSWVYTVSLTEKGCLSCLVAGSPKTTPGTTMTFSGLQPDHQYDYYVCTENCSSGKLVTSGTQKTDPCPITYMAKLTSHGSASSVVAQSGTIPESLNPTTKFSNSSIAANTPYDFYVFSPATATSVYYQGTATSDSACAAQNPPGPPTLLQPKGAGDFANPTFSWSSVSGATYYKVLVKAGDTNFSTGPFWGKATSGSATSLPWSGSSGWSSANGAGSPPPSFLTGTTYYWTAWSCNDSTGGCSLAGAASPVSFSVSGGGPQPQPPGPPTLLQPKGAGDFANPTFSWSSVSGATYYQVLVKPNDSNFSAGGFWGKQTLNTSLAWNGGSGWNSQGAGGPPATFSTGVTYYWVAWSCNDSTGGCSLAGAASPVSFSVSGGGPAQTKPVPIAPKGDVSDGNPAFRWQPAVGVTTVKYSLWLKQTDGNFGAGNFWAKDVQLSACTSAECSTSLGDQWKWVTSSSQTASNPPSPLSAGSWFWLVIACKTNACTFGDQVLSDIISFSVPGAAALLPAANLTQTVGTCKSNQKVDVTFDWVPSTSPGVVEQWVDLSLQNNNFADGTYLGAGPFAASTSSYSWSDLVGGQVHYWRVNTKFSDGQWKPSGVASFSTPNCAPRQQNPILNSTVICEGGLNKIKYDVQIFDNIDTALIVSDKSDLSSAYASVRIKPPGDTYKFTPAHTGLWYAQLNRYAFIDGTKRANPIKSLSCGQPLEVSPPSNLKVIEKSCNQNDDYTSVKIGWTSNDPRATGFYVTLYKGSDIVFHDQAVNNSWIDLNNLDAGATYSITVSADAGGTRSAATTPFSFQAPPCPGRFDTVRVDTICTQDNKVEATFYWNPSTGAQGYVVDLSTVGPPNTWNGLNQTFINNTNDPNRIPLATSYTWEGLTAGATHYWRVYAYNGEFGRHAYGADFAKSCGGVSNDKQVLKDTLHAYIVEKRPINDYQENRSVTEDERNIFAGKMFNVMLQESFGNDYPSTAYNRAGWYGIFQYTTDTWCRGICRPYAATVGSNIWYKPDVDSGAPNFPPDQRDGIKDGDIFNPYSQVERTVWTWDGAEKGSYGSGEWGPYNIWFGGESPFVCNVRPAKCAL